MLIQLHFHLSSYSVHTSAGFDSLQATGAFGWLTKTRKGLEGDTTAGREGEASNIVMGLSFRDPSIAMST
jgi:hypothetical protein